jgi:hypothetical protein
MFGMPFTENDRRDRDPDRRSSKSAKIETSWEPRSWRTEYDGSPQMRPTYRLIGPAAPSGALVVSRRSLSQKPASSAAAVNSSRKLGCAISIRARARSVEDFRLRLRMP